MSETDRITPDHLRRCALVYVRQSSAAQVEHNRESTERQYRLVVDAEGVPRIMRSVTLRPGEELDLGELCFAAGGRLLPHPTQRAAAGAPHSRQNFARSGLLWPQLGQIMPAS